MTDRELALINKLDKFVNDEEDDSDFEFEEYRELNNLLQKNVELVSLCKKLYNAADMLCDRMLDFPAGCDACSLCDEDDGSCYFKEVGEKYKEIIG